MSSLTKVIILVAIISAVFAGGIQFITKKKAEKAAEEARKRQYKNKAKNKRKK